MFVISVVIQYGKKNIGKIKIKPIHFHYLVSIFILPCFVIYQATNKKNLVNKSTQRSTQGGLFISH